MRRLLKSFTAFSVIAMLLFSFCISVGAVEETHNSQDGLVASITTKKDGYQSNEDIDLTFKVTNTNDFTVENVSSAFRKDIAYFRRECFQRRDYRKGRIFRFVKAKR